MATVRVVSGALAGAPLGRLRRSGACRDAGRRGVSGLCLGCIGCVERLVVERGVVAQAGEHSEERLRAALMDDVDTVLGAVCAGLLHLRQLLEVAP